LKITQSKIGAVHTREVFRTIVAAEVSHDANERQNFSFNRPFPSIQAAPDACQVGVVVGSIRKTNCPKLESALTQVL
jgi:hypothetical protein